MDKPETSMVRAGDVKPYEWALWCRIEGGEPFANDIVHIKTNNDGSLSFMLDTHNFLFAQPDEMIELIHKQKVK